MLIATPNGLDLKRIAPNNGEKFSPNLYNWLKSQRSAWAYRVYRDEEKTLWIGLLHEGKEVLGARLIDVLCNGKRAFNACWSPKSPVTEVTDFWNRYT